LTPVRAVVLDLGGVLVDWDPRHLYRKLFPGDEEATEHFLAAFDGIVISGAVGFEKPDSAIYRHLLDTYALEPASTPFIDDSAPNVEAARALGLQGLRFESAAQARRELEARRLV
jgi:FMN phosphatase YigB (HAD superfamily)